MRGATDPDLFHLDFDGVTVRDVDDVVLAGLDDPRHRQRVPGLTVMLDDPAIPDLERLYALYTLASWGELRGYDAVVVACADPEAVPWRGVSTDRLFSHDNTFGLLAAAVGRDGLARQKGTEPRRRDALVALVSVADQVYFDGQLESVLEPSDDVVAELVAAVRRGVARLHSDEPTGFDVATQLVDLIGAVADDRTGLAVGLALDVVHAAPEPRVLRHAAELASGSRNAAVDDFREYLATIGDDGVRRRLGEVAARAASSVTYFGAVPPGRTRATIAGVVRRSTAGAHPVDEVFTRNLRWEPTTALVEHGLGHGETEYVEISGVEADSFVERITQRLSS